jgi:MtN3 and saliva related transmembrane protein
VPQVIKVYKTKKTNDISTGMFILFITGLLLWLAYGIIVSSIPIIAANSVTAILSIYILFMKIKLDHGKKEKTVQDVNDASITSKVLQEK